MISLDLSVCNIYLLKAFISKSKFCFQPDSFIFIMYQRNNFKTFFNSRENYYCMKYVDENFQH